MNLIGEHTDHSGGLVLPAAIDRGITLTAAADDRIRLRSDREADAVDVGADGTDPPAAGWGRYVAAVARELDLRGRPPVGLAGEVSSDLPAGSGLSSSAALEVAVASALTAVAEFRLEPLALAAACQRAEQRAVGVPCGIMDQAACVLGRARHALLLDCASLEWRHVPLPEDLAVVLIDSGVRRRLEDSGYARRLRELQPGLAVLAAAGRSSSHVTAEEAVRLARAAGLDDLAVRRLRHVVTENGRVRAVEQALGAGERVLRAGERALRAGERALRAGAGAGGHRLRALGRLFAEGHASLRDDFDVSVPELDLLVGLAVEAGAVAARMTGGGFGGAVVVLAERDGAQALASRVAQAYRRRSGREPAVLVTEAADGAGEWS